MYSTTTTTTSFHVSIAFLFSREGENGRYITSDSSRSYPHQCPTPSTAKSGGKQEIEKKKNIYCCTKEEENWNRSVDGKRRKGFGRDILLCCYTYTHIPILAMHLPCIYRRTIYLYYQMEERERERYSLLVRLLLR